jgi:hypothetical protein
MSVDRRRAEPWIGAQAYAPTNIYVAERRYVRRHRCGCVVHPLCR